MHLDPNTEDNDCADIIDATCSQAVATPFAPASAFSFPAEATTTFNAVCDLPTLPYRNGESSDAEISSALAAAARVGVLHVTGLAPAPFDDIRCAMDKVAGNPSLAERANKAYTQNLVWKDSFAQ
eukprot:scaffold12273_cov29-Prasinocladus_malaysianus.AAC.2